MSYISPINSRYKAHILSKLWSSDSKIMKMRQLWIDLAFFQKQNTTFQSKQTDSRFTLPTARIYAD